jgi:uncharacterized membrane protein YgcG
MDSSENEADITVDSGADMTIAPLPELNNVALGSTLSEPIVWSNTGNLTAPSSILSFDAMAGLQFKQHFSNCKYSKPDGALALVHVVCTINQPLAPGKSLRLAQNVQLGVTGAAYYAVMSASVLPPGGVRNEDAASRNYLHGTGPVLTAVDATAAAARNRNVVGDINPRDSYTELDIHAKNTADFAAVGASVKGDKGKTVQVTVGARNNGPALIYDRSGGEGIGGLRVTFPAGVTVTKIPSGCELDSRTGVAGHGPYDCGTSYVEAPGYQVLDTFSVRLDDQLLNVKGSVALDNELSDITGKPVTFPWDHNSADNTAAIVFNGPAQPTTTPSSEASSTTSGGGTSGGQGASTGGSVGGGGLAVTGGGSSALPLSLGAAATVTLGAGALLLTRRRRAAQHS